jgi:hypothetical protein
VIVPFPKKYTTASSRNDVAFQAAESIAELSFRDGWNAAREELASRLRQTLPYMGHPGDRALVEKVAELIEGGVL